MAYYGSVPRVFPSGGGVYNTDAPPQKITVDTGVGGIVTIAAAIAGTTWVDVYVVKESSSFYIEVSQQRLRITPSGGATYNYGEEV